MHPYYQFLRLIAVFLFLSPWLQSCMPSSKRAYAPKQDKLLNKAANNAKALCLAKQEAIGEIQANAQNLSPSQKLASSFHLVANPVTITNKLFTSIGGEKMIFSQEGGVCIARMITASCTGLGITAPLPVFCEQQRPAWLMLQLLGQQEPKLHKRRIHILHSKDRDKYVFLGSLGLLGGMQVARKPKSVALHEAAKQGDVGVVQKLLATGADPEGLDKYGFTPLEYATWQGYAAIVRLLLDNGAMPNKDTDLSYSYLHLAAIKGHLEIAKLLLEKGADVDARTVCNNISCTPLHVAVNCGHVDIVQLLLENGAEAKLTSELGISTFDWAAQHGHLGIIKLLLAKEHIFNIAENRYRKALYLAVENGHVPVVKLFLELGADPNITNADDTTFT